jgi:glutaconate CoA-transferase subunit B
VVTNLGILEPDASGELVLAALHPGAEVSQAVENTGWPLRLAETLRTTDPVSQEELRLLRDLDPERIYLGGKGQ